MPKDANDTRLLVPDDTVWRLERADRLSVIVDAADYFRHLRSALRQARQAVYLIGWDFDLRLEMLPGEGDRDGNAPDGLPNRLGPFLERIVDDAPNLSLHILKWDKAMLAELAQQASETLSLKLSSGRIHFALDSHHPLGATHHQKVVAIDDAVAFCGGIDVTGGRWDTSEHAPEDDRRHLPDGTIHQPWHDVTTALSGPAAAGLGDLARARWEKATGTELDPPAAAGTPWPEDLSADLEGVEIGIARTEPDYREQDRVDEIERLYLAALEAARETVYLESQYFASGAVCRLLERRMARPDAPELLVINPRTADGPVEHAIMDTARARMIERVREAAEAGGNGHKFRIFHPVNAAGDPIYVHAKVLIVDDRLLRIGSSNVNNRSMDFDTECDVALEPRDAEARAFVLGLRHRLLAEHLDRAPGEVAEAVTRHGGLIAAAEALNGASGRRLVAIEPPEGTAVRAAGDRLLFDDDAHPRNRPRPVQAVTHGAKRAMAPYHVETVGAGTVLLAAAALGLGIWAGLRLARTRRSRRLAAPAVHRPEPHAPAPTPPVVAVRRPDIRKD